MKNLGVAKKIIGVSFLLTLVSNPFVFSSEEKIFNVEKPAILEFDYKRREIAAYSGSMRTKTHAEGFLNGYENTTMNFNTKIEVINDEEETFQIKTIMQKLHQKSMGEYNGIKLNLESNFDINNEKEQEKLEAYNCAYSITKTGELFRHNLYDSCICDIFAAEIDFFPDHAIKIGDKWVSYGNTIKVPFIKEEGIIFKTLKADISLKLSKETKYKGVSALVIEFYGQSKPKEDGKGGIKGQLIYDPIKKKILQVDMKTNASITDRIMEEDEETRTKFNMEINTSIKKD